MTALVASAVILAAAALLCAFVAGMEVQKVVHTVQRHRWARERAALLNEAERTRKGHVADMDALLNQLRDVERGRNEADARALSLAAMLHDLTGVRP